LSLLFDNFSLDYVHLKSLIFILILCSLVILIHARNGLFLYFMLVSLVANLVYFGFHYVFVMISS